MPAMKRTAGEGSIIPRLFEEKVNEIGMPLVVLDTQIVPSLPRASHFCSVSCIRTTKKLERRHIRGRKAKY